MNKKKIAVIIPTCKPDRAFGQLLKRLAVQDYPIAKILIMNTERQYWNPEWEQYFGDIRVVHLSKAEFDHGQTRDRAARLLDADILVYMTQDAMPADKGLIKNLVKYLERPDIKAVYARQLPRKGDDIIERYTRAYNYPRNSDVRQYRDLRRLGIKTYFCSNVCAAYDRSTYLELGGFISHTIFNEDMIFAARLLKAGYKIAYAADARVIHSHNYSNLQQLRRNFDIAVSQTDHPEIFQGVRSEGEGLRLVKRTAAYLIRQRKPWLVVSLGIKSICKYSGYLLGKNYHRLPRQLILKLTMNQDYWG